MVNLFSSLKKRLLFTATGILIIFLVGLAYIIDRAYQAGLESQVEARLQSMVFSLLTAIEESDQGKLVIPEEVAEPSFNNVGSGLYAIALVKQGDLEAGVIWKSRSTIGMESFMKYDLLPQNEQLFEVIHQKNINDGASIFTFSKGFSWETFSGESLLLTLAVIEDRGEYLKQLESFRLTLFVGLGFVTLFLFLAQWLMLRWGLLPVQRMEADLERIEVGDAKLLPVDYPLELKGVTAKLNMLLENEREQIERYKNTMADLAHSLKTPLAILQGWLDDPKQKGLLVKSDQETLGTQISRMDQAVQYHLQRSIASGNRGATVAIPIADVVNQIISAMQKVYSDKGISVTHSVASEAVFWGVKGDLMELLGNLIENAFKYTKDKVHVGAKGGCKDKKTGLYLPCKIWVEDNGPGIPDKQKLAILERGARLDTQISGHGIGLAIVKDILENYKGEICILTSALGGACFQCRIQPFVSSAYRA